MWKLCLIALSLAACSSPTVVKERVSVAKLPVSVPCASARPERPVALSQQFTNAEWSALAPRAKASQIGAQALRWQNYGEKADAATLGCP